MRRAALWGGPSIALSAREADVKPETPRRRRPRKRRGTRSGPPHAAYDNETLDHLLSFVDGSPNMGRMLIPFKGARDIGPAVAARAW